MSRLVAHTGGFGWDEALVFVLPVVVLIAARRAGRRKAAREQQDGDPAEGDEGVG